MKKKVIASCVALVMAMGILGGCTTGKGTSTVASSDNTANATDTTNKDSKDKENITLRFLWWGGDARHKATLEVIDKYMSLNPNVKIEAEYGGFDGYQQKILTQISGGTAPDIMQLDAPWLPDLIAQGDILADLNSFSNIDISGFDKKFLDDTSVFNDKLVGLPTGLNAATIIYNKDLYDQYDISQDTVWDWESLHRVGKELHEKDSAQYLIGGDVGIVFFMLRGYINQITGNQWIKDDYTIGFDREALIKGFTYLNSLVNDGVIERFEEMTLFEGKYQDNPNWVNKKVVLSPTWTSMMSAYKKDDTFNLDTTRYPIAKDSKTTSIIVRPAQVLSISDNSKNKEEAAEFLNWFYNDEEAIRILGDVRSMPPTTKAREKLAELQLIDPAIVKGIDVALKDAGAPEGALTNNSELEKILRNAIEQVGFGKATPEQAADDMIAAFTKKLEELKTQQ